MNSGSQAIRNMPNLFIVGVQKAGTTSLHAHLSRVPGIFMPDVKEPGFFMKNGNDEVFRTKNLTCRQSERQYASPEEYAALFASADGCPWRGESTTGYFASDYARRHIKRVVPDPRIIICLREPVARAYSAYNWARKTGWEPCESFEEALALEEARRRDGYWFAYDYSGTSRYSPLLKKWLDDFPHVKIVLFEELRDNPAAVVADIARWLDIEGPTPDFAEAEASNPSGVDASLLGKLGRRVVTKPRSQQGMAFRLARRLIGEAGARVIKNRMTRALDRRVVRPAPLAPETRAELRTRFEGEIGVVERLIEKDLSLWRR